jgi:predicted dehydrogenase
MPTTYRAGIIGWTGRGNYGHRLDVAYEGMSNVRVVALSDPDPVGREEAGKRTGASRLYADFHEMLEKEELDLVNVCPRVAGSREEMVIAAAESGVKGILCEKPIAQTLAQADAMIEACDRRGVRIAVAHRRANAYEQYAKKLVDEGEIGDLQVIRSHGKADHRAGAMDLIVLGTHMMDSMRFFAGSDVEWAHGHVTQDGRDVSLADVTEGDEEVGLIAGNGVAAYYAFKNGVAAHFESYRGDVSRKGISGRWMGFEVYGTKGVFSLRNSPAGELYRYPHGLWVPGEDDGRWERVILDEWDNPDLPPGARRDAPHRSNQMIVAELVRAIEADRDVEKVSSGRDARAALEMIMAVHESQRLKARVPFPMENRQNPYETWRGEKG